MSALREIGVGAVTGGIPLAGWLLGRNVVAWAMESPGDAIGLGAWVLTAAITVASLVVEVRTPWP